MALRKTALYDRIYGCLLGAAIGDAFGMRAEMMHYRDIAAQYGRVEHFDPLPPRQPSRQPPREIWNSFGQETGHAEGFDPLGRWSNEVGVYTDDMRYRLLACQAILKKRGPITGRDFAAEWLNYRLMAEGASEHEPTLSWPGPQRAYARHMASLDMLVRVAGAKHPLIPGWDAPVGLIHAGDPEAAAAEGSPMAVAVAAALSPGATMGTVIAAVLRHADCLQNDILCPDANEFTGRINRLMGIVAGCRTTADLYEPFYREFIVTFPPWNLVWTMEMIPAALGICAIARDDPREAIIGAANLGRDADTITGMAGELMGALRGAHALPQDWVEKVVRLNPQPDLAQMAEALCALVVERAEAQQRRAAAVLSLAEESHWIGG